MAKSAPKPEEPSSNDIIASLMERHKDTLYNDIIPVNRLVSTGSLNLDQYVKIRSGSVVRLLGKGAELGKTSEAFVLSANYMAVMPKSKTLYIKAEARLTPEMRARSGHTFVTKAADWAYGTVLVLSMNDFEDTAGILETMIKETHARGEHLCIIIDALDGLILKGDRETKGIGDNTMVAGVPKLTKLLFRRIGLSITHFDVLLVLLSQYSTDIKINPHAPAAPRQGTASGGSAVMHQADYALQYAQRYGGDYILEDPDEKPDPKTNRILGVWATLEILKSAADTSGIKVKIPIKKGRIGSAIWVEKEVVDLALSFDLLKREGPKSPMYAFDPVLIKEAKEAGVELKDKIKGFANVYEYVEGDPKVFQWLLERFRRLLKTEEAT